MVGSRLDLTFLAPNLGINTAGLVSSKFLCTTFSGALVLTFSIRASLEGALAKISKESSLTRVALVPAGAPADG